MVIVCACVCVPEYAYNMLSNTNVCGDGVSTSPPPQKNFRSKMLAMKTKMGRLMIIMNVEKNT